MSELRVCADSGGALFARIAPRARRVHVAILARTVDGAAVVVAVVHCSASNGSSSVGPWTLDQREATAVIGERGREAAVAAAIDALEESLRAEIARLPQLAGSAPVPPASRADLEAQIVAASIRGDAVAQAALEADLVERNTGLGKHARPVQRPRQFRQPGEMVMHSDDVPRTSGPPRGTGFL